MNTQIEDSKTDYSYFMTCIFIIIKIIRAQRSIWFQRTVFLCKYRNHQQISSMLLLVDTIYYVIETNSKQHLFPTLSLKT